MRTFFKRMAALAAAIAVTAFSGCSSTGNTSAETTATSAQAEIVSKTSEWNDLDQTEITSAMGMGWNLGNQLEASNSGIPSETAWGNPVITEELIKTVKEQGFKTVRIPVSYLLKIGDAPDYKINDEWLNRVQEVVDYVVNNDLYAVVNMHGDGYYTVDKGWLLCVEDDEKQVEIKAKYEAVWKQIAERFKDYDEHLIFESMNEEFDNTYGKPNPKGYENINAYNQIFVDTVRKTGSNNAKRWLLLPGWNTNIEYTAGDFGFVIPTDSHCEANGNRLMISVHYYDPYNFTLDENMTSAKTQWGKYAVENFDNWGQEDYVDSTMKKLNDTFVSKGYPVIIGEMGVQNKSHVSDTFNVFRCYWMEYVVKAAKENGCIPIYWDNGWNGDKGFGVINRTNCEITQPELIAAMMKAMNSDGDYEIAAPAGFEKK
ncbi:MAG: glycoside hydrolase family 5 protein [Lachnospiraceae bacterium]|nr:glycoside hydrolase family 5 protein [Lachnospiraceae bacterium]